MSVVGDRMCECRRYECSAAVVTRKDLGQLVVDLRPVRLRGMTTDYHMNNDLL